jgi:sugar transferase (PEP-CTERM/EpsH1 system associated)
VKILVLDEFLSYPVDSGKKVRTYNILKQLSSKHRITLLTFVWGDAREESGLAHFRSLGIDVLTIRRANPKKSGPGFYFRLFANLFSSLPYIVDGHYLRPYADRLAELIAEWKPDIILAEWSPYSIYLRGFAGLPRVAVAHNLESNIWKGYVEKCTNPVKRLYIAGQYKKVIRFEDHIFNWLEGLITVSPVEYEQVAEKYPKIKVALVENGVDIEYFSPSDVAEDETLISFTASMDWRPNQDAMQYFIREIWPLLKARMAEIQMLVIGRGAPDWLVALGEKNGLRFTGAADDIRPYVHSSAVSVVPLRIGGGSRLKILEAAAMGKAIVSTRLGAEGLQVRPDEHLLIADTPQEFADAIVRLLKNREMRRKLGQAGRRLVCNRYRWENLAAIQSEFLESLAAR